jgi:lysyl-tRNA synthetase, class II
MDTSPDGHYAQRIAKLDLLRERGVDPYPNRSERTHSVAEALEAFDSDNPIEVTVAGRIVGGIRGHGKTSFCHIQESAGRIQLYFKQDVLGAERFEHFRLLDIGDFIEAGGQLFRTRTGEVTVEVRSFRLLSKALRPLPEKWHGLADVETRYRQRYLDLVSNEKVRQTFITRSRVIRAVRGFLDNQGFIEVETPALQPIYGGAAARPFVTHHNALDERLYLRIATELYLKRLVVGGIEKVYEIGKNFRNEGISTVHNPEFTVMESYEAYADYNRVMAMLEEMISTVARDVLGTTTITYQGHEVSLEPPWRRISVRDAVREYAGVDYEDFPDQSSLWRRAGEIGVKLPPTTPRGKIIDELRDRCVERHLIQPTFLIDYPAEISPLAKRVPSDPSLVERFEAFVGGMEFANAYSELNDPLDQRRRFEEQVAERESGDQEAHPMDEDYLIALEHGMPPTGGLGVGIDRLVMLLTDQSSIREVILFPQLRNKV